MPHKKLFISTLIPFAFFGFMGFSCSKPDYSTTWTGGSKEYTPSYKPLDSVIVSPSTALNVYLNDNAKLMISQDVVRSCNYYWDTYSGDDYTYHAKCNQINKEEGRISFYSSISQDGIKVMEIEAIDLPYWAQLDSSITASAHIILVPKNTTFYDETFIVNDAFWKDIKFEVIANTFSSDGKILQSYVLNYKNMQPGDRFAWQETFGRLCILGQHYFMNITPITEEINLLE